MSHTLPASGPTGLGGWLLLPLAGLVATVLIGVYGISDVLASMETLLRTLSYKASITVEIVGVVVFWVLLPAVSLVLLAMRSRHFPTIFAVNNIALAVFGILDPFILAIDYSFSPEALLYGAIPAVWFLGWTWYMLVSVRVKATFVN
jgi:hypothetical protein